MAIGRLTATPTVFPAPPTREQLTAPLTSNGYTLDMSPRRLGDLPEADAEAPLDELRAQLARDGFLWFRGFLDPGKIWDFRERYFEAHRESGLLAPGSAAVDGIYSGDWDIERVPRLQYEIARWASYDALTADDRLGRSSRSFSAGRPTCTGGRSSGPSRAARSRPEPTTTSPTSARGPIGS